MGTDKERLQGPGEQKTGRSQGQGVEDRGLMNKGPGVCEPMLLGIRNKGLTRISCPFLMHRSAPVAKLAQECHPRVVLCPDVHAQRS
jgi:hypothetical protein